MVNIIIPIYKAKDTLPMALDSLCVQTKKTFIVTLVNDADNEDYTDIINDYKNRGLHIHYLELSENKGPGVARQFGIDNTTSCDYIMFMDADDIYYPNAVEMLYNEAKTKNADLVISNIETEKNGRPSKIIDVDSGLITWCFGKIYKLSYLRRNKIRFLDNLRLNEDSYFNLVSAGATSKKYKIKYTTYYWRDNKNSLTRRVSQEEFEKESNTQYLLSQIEAILKLTELKADIDPITISNTLLNMYYHMMLGDILNISRKEYSEKLKLLKNNDIIKKWQKDPENWIYIMKNCKIGSILDLKILFFKTNFIEWYNYFIRNEV